MLTQLDIINSMLASTGTAPLTSNDTQHPYYAKAMAVLTRVNRAAQSRGWWFNTTTRTLKPTTAGEIILPSTVLHADPTKRTDKLTLRGNRLYDMKTASFNIGREVEVFYKELVDISDLPPSAGEYVQAQAVYTFYRDEDSSGPKLREYKEAARDARIELRSEHLKNADVNFFASDSAIAMRRHGRARRLPL